MALNPQVLQRAQNELDTLLGPPSSNEDCRMPKMDDRGRLPYINALAKEVWRWNPALPLGTCAAKVQAGL